MELAMTEKPTGAAAIKIAKGARNVRLKNVTVAGSRPFDIEPGADVTFENVHVQRHARPAASKSFSGWSGKAQFDPKREAPKDNDPFYGPKLLLAEGPHKQMAELDEVSRRFFANKPYASVSEVDAETGDLVHKLKATASPSARLRYVAYAAVNDLRNAPPLLSTHS
jgi:hypothetical protein